MAELYAAFGSCNNAMHRGAWELLDRLVMRFAHLGEPADRMPLIAFWLEVGRAAVRLSKAPRGPAVAAEVQALLERARAGQVGSAVLSLQELVAVPSK